MLEMAREEDGQTRGREIESVCQTSGTGSLLGWKEVIDKDKNENRQSLDLLNLLPQESKGGFFSVFLCYDVRKK